MLALHAVLSLITFPITLQAPDTVRWRYSASQDVIFLRLTPLGSVVVSTLGALTALDPASGQAIWMRSDIKDVHDGAFDVLPLTPYGVVRSRNGIAVLDLQTGATRWDSTAVPLQNVRGYFHVPQHRMLLLYGRGRPEGRALVAMDVDSGTVKWEQRALLRSDPEQWDIDYVHTLSGHQPPLADTDTTLILYINKDGPFKIHAATGALLWRVDALKGEDPPTLATSYPPLTLGDALLLVPYAKKLMAVDPSDGHVLWTRAKNFDSPLSQMQVTWRGILVRGTRPPDTKAQPGMPDAFLDLVDLKAGSSLWPRSFREMKHESTAPFLVAGDTVYLGDRERLFAVTLQDGASRELARYEFEGGEEPVAVEQRGDALVLLSAHNWVLVNPRSAQTAHRYYPAPGTSLLGKLGKAALFVASAATEAAAEEQRGRPGLHVTPTFEYNPFIKERVQGAVRAFREHAFIYTRAPDRAGREGFSLIRVGKADGQESARLWFGERAPEYVLDAATGTVYAKRGNREIVALRFFEP